MPYPEYRSWELFFSLEPFGWGANHTWLYNINRGKAAAKSQDEMLSDRLDEILEQLREAPDLGEMSAEKRREFIRAQIKKDFGIQ